VELPELRIIDDALRESVKGRPGETALGRGSADLNRAHRPRYVFSGLLRCASCGASLTLISASHVGCAAAARVNDLTPVTPFSVRGESDGADAQGAPHPFATLSRCRGNSALSISALHRANRPSA
jgi:hypothetical protein